MVHSSFHKLASGLLAVSLLLNACTRLTPASSTATNAASPTAETERGTPPPGATLTVNGQTQAAGVGSYCWITNTGNASTSTCAEQVGLPTAREPLVIVDATFTGRFNLDIPIPPDSVILSVTPITPASEIPSADAGHRLWRTGSGWGAGLPLKTDIEYPFQAAEFANGNGLYLAELNARWKNSGNVTYGFLMQIGAGSSGLSAQFPTSTAGSSVPTPVSFTLHTVSPSTWLGKGAASSLTISPDGHWLGIVTPLGAYLFDTGTQQQIWFRAFDNTPTTLAFSPDSSRLAVGSRASVLSILAVQTGKTVFQIKGEENIHATWSPDGTRLLVSGGCQGISIWNAENSTLLQALQPVKCNDVDPGYVDAVWSADGKRIFSATLAWDASTYQPLVNYKPDLPEFVVGYSLLPSPVGNFLAVGNGLSVAILDGETGQKKMTFTPSVQTVSLGNIAWSPDGKKLVAGNYYVQFIWSMGTGPQIATPNGYRALAGLAWMPDDKTLIGLFSPDGRLNAVDVTTGKVLFSLDGFDATTRFPTNPNYPKWDGKDLLTDDGTNIVRWDTSTGTIVSRTSAPPLPDWASKYGGDVALSPDGKRAAAGLSVVDVITGQELAHLEVTPAGGWDKVAWSPDGKRIVSGDTGGDNASVVWDAQTGKVLLNLPFNADGTTPYLGGLAWSPDGALIVAGGSLMDQSGMHNGMLILWNASSGKQIRLLTDGMTGQRINALAWSPDGQWLAAGSASGKIILWDMRQYRPIDVLVGHSDQVVGLNWSTDSTFLASNGLDGTVLIWKLP